MNHDTAATFNAGVPCAGNSVVCSADTEVFVSMGRCELAGCRAVASGILTDELGYSMELCPKCAAGELLELARLLIAPTWQVFEHHGMRGVQ